jgi:hypothetical protein
MFAISSTSALGKEVMTEDYLINSYSALCMFTFFNDKNTIYLNNEVALWNMTVLTH